MRLRKAPKRMARPRMVTRVPHPWDHPETEFPAIVPVGTLLLDRSEWAAVAITGIWAYSRGFEFSVTLLIRPGTPGWDEIPAPGWDEGPVPGPAGHRFARPSAETSLRFSDGRTVTSGRPHGDSEPAGPILRPHGGGGSSHYQNHRWWVWPLPPGGPLDFVYPGLSSGTGETRVSIDAGLILDAARRIIPPWAPDDGAPA
jgi:hypothetical protein